MSTLVKYFWEADTTKLYHSVLQLVCMEPQCQRNSQKALASLGYFRILEYRWINPHWSLTIFLDLQNSFHCNHLCRNLGVPLDSLLSISSSTSLPCDSWIYPYSHVPVQDLMFLHFLPSSSNPFSIYWYIAMCISHYISPVWYILFTCNDVNYLFKFSSFIFYQFSAEWSSRSLPP